jgi:hypothetical protein
MNENHQRIKNLKIIPDIKHKTNSTDNHFKGHSRYQPYAD